MSGIASTGTGSRGRSPEFQLNGMNTTPNTIKVIRKIKVINRFSRKNFTSRLNIIHAISTMSSKFIEMFDIQLLFLGIWFNLSLFFSGEKAITRVSPIEKDC
jgi:hypothetical protein